MIDIYKLGIAALLAVGLSGCTSAAAKVNSIAPAAPNWWQHYQIAGFDKLSQQLAENNFDIAQLQIAVQLASLNREASVNSVKLNAALSANRNWQLRAPKAQSDSVNASLGASYELDLWRKLTRNSKAAALNEQAARCELRALQQLKQQALLSAIIKLSANAASAALARQQLQNLETIHAIQQQQLELGKLDAASVHSSWQALQQAKQRLNRSDHEALNLQQQLQDLLASKTAKFALADFNSINALKLKLTRPAYIIGARADICAAAARAQASEILVLPEYKYWLPNLALNAALNSAGSSWSKLWQQPLALFAVNMQLPFLNPQATKRQIKQHKLEAQSALLALQKTSLEALNEVNAKYAIYQLAAAQLQLSTQELQQQRKQQQLAHKAYKVGKRDLQYWLQANNQLLQHQQQTLQDKQQLLLCEVDLLAALSVYPE